MATSGALGGFLQAMLQLRAQRLQEEEAKQRASQAGMSSLMSGITSGIGSIMGGLQTAGENKMYNQLSTEAFGQPVRRATSANAGVQRAADLAASRMPGGLASSTAFGPQFTGGKPEFEARMKLMELQDKISTGKAGELRKAAAESRAQGYYDIRAGEAARAARAAELKARNDAFEGMSKQAKEIYGDTAGYLKASTGFLDDIQKAQAGEGDFAAWKTAADELTKMNAVHKGRKLTTALVDVPPFFPENQQKLLKDYEDAKRVAAGAPATTGMFGRESPEARALREAGTAATGVSVPYPGGAPRYAPPNTPLSAELVNRAQQNPQQLSPQEAQQLGMQGPPAPAAPAPGVAPLARRNPKTGQISVYNHRTGEWEIK